MHWQANLTPSVYSYLKPGLYVLQKTDWAMKGLAVPVLKVAKCKPTQAHWGWPLTATLVIQLLRSNDKSRQPLLEFLVLEMTERVLANSNPASTVTSYIEPRWAWTSADSRTSKLFDKMKPGIFNQQLLGLNNLKFVAASIWIKSQICSLTLLSWAPSLKSRCYRKKTRNE